MLHAKKQCQKKPKSDFCPKLVQLQKLLVYCDQRPSEISTKGDFYNQQQAIAQELTWTPPASPAPVSHGWAHHHYDLPSKLLSRVSVMPQNTDSKLFLDECAKFYAYHHS